jgi:thiazole synthase ThiGH ThiG subunit
MLKAIESGRQAYLAGRMEKTPLASASSPQKGLME